MDWRSMTRTNLPVSAERLWADVMALAAITEPEVPYTRRSFTPKFQEGRDFLRRRFESAGLTVRIDAGGNMIGHRAGREAGRGTILIGSHSDTVPGGGRFDGVAGVATALEVARSLADRGVELAHDLEVVDFLAEEVSAFRISCVGSRAMAGRLTPEMLTEEGPGGEKLSDALKRVGGDPAALPNALRSDIAAFLELHIEQGRVLEAAGEDIGVVRTIAGITRIGLVIEGRADHAGTTPMSLREDALSGAVEIVRAIRDEARARAEAGEGYFVATTGELHLEPNAGNVVPRQVRLLIDARAEGRETMESFLRWMKEALPPLAAAQRAKLTSCDVLSDATPAIMDPAICRTLAEAAGGLGLSCREMTSGAGHDAAWVSRFAPAAMIFIPCRDGRSHTPEEWAESHQLAAGAAVMFDAVLRIDRMLLNKVRG
jgi:N-carbamoyl-L-amino-acid hydrolase